MPGTDEFVSYPDNISLRFTNEKKVNSLAASAGLVVKCTPWLYNSVGLGYGKRNCYVNIKRPVGMMLVYRKTTGLKNTDYSHEGVVVDLDFMVKFGSVFVSAGCNTLNFKYVDLNAGVGVFF